MMADDVPGVRLASPGASADKTSREARPDDNTPLDETTSEAGAGLNKAVRSQGGVQRSLGEGRQNLHQGARPVAPMRELFLGKLSASRPIAICAREGSSVSSRQNLSRVTAL